MTNLMALIIFILTLDKERDRIAEINFKTVDYLKNQGIDVEKLFLNIFTFFGCMGTLIIFFYGWIVTYDTSLKGFLVMFSFASICLTVFIAPKYLRL